MYISFCQVFPVEEARVVQEFLSAVEGEVEEEISEEMTADQLLEKLERLEMLQQTQSQKEGEVLAIDRSAESEEVKRALKKNPDISKERNNLLQGEKGLGLAVKFAIGRLYGTKKNSRDKKIFHVTRDEKRRKFSPGKTFHYNMYMYM